MISSTTFDVPTENEDMDVQHVGATKTNVETWRHEDILNEYPWMNMNLFWLFLIFMNFDID